MSEVRSISPRGKWLRIACSIAILIAVTIADYWSGFEMSFAVFYLIPVLITAWNFGWKPGLLVSMVSVACSLAGDLASGARYHSALVPWWNMVILLGFYLSIVILISQLRASRRDLESRVRERTAELSGEIAARERLEKALLDVSEREQRRIGHDLHDSLCQHLTGTALAAQVLSGNLSSRNPDEAKDADRLVAMIEDGIGLSRRLARGLAPVELDADGLVTALRELARYTAEHTKMKCGVDVSSVAPILDPQVTTQLFRIAQEAVRNSVRHSGGGVISIGLRDLSDGLEMSIKDDGRSGRREVDERGGGMGLHIMRYRASMIGAEFAAGGDGNGFRVVVRVPPSQ